MSTTASDVPDSGQLPGRYEFVPEPARGEVPIDPDYQRLSDVIRSFEAEEGASLARQDGLGTPDAVDHNRGTEEPSLSVGYDLQRFFTDGSDNPQDASGYGLLRDEYNRLPGTLLVVARRDHPGGNDDAGVREFTVVRGAAVDTVSPTLDPSSEQPILMELEFQPAKVRSYLVHQPSAATTLELSSTSENDTMDVTIEDEGANTTEDVTLNGSTAVTTTTEFGDIDAIWVQDAPEGDIEVTDGSGTTLCTLEGGLTYSDDDQPVDGDQGVPALGAGSHADPIGTTFEHFLGDKFERPTGEDIRPRVNSASWTVENSIGTESLHDTRAPAIDEANRAVSIEADVGGKFVTHDSMMEALQKVQHDLLHELSGGGVTFKNTVPTDAAADTREAEQGAASLSETLEPSGDPMIQFSAN